MNHKTLGEIFQEIYDKFSDMEPTTLDRVLGVRLKQRLSSSGEELHCVEPRGSMMNVSIWWRRFCDAGVWAMRQCLTKLLSTFRVPKLMLGRNKRYEILPATDYDHPKAIRATLYHISNSGQGRNAGQIWAIDSFLKPPVCPCFSRFAGLSMPQPQAIEPVWI